MVWEWESLCPDKWPKGGTFDEISTFIYVAPNGSGCIHFKLIARRKKHEHCPLMSHGQPHSPQIWPKLTTNRGRMFSSLSALRSTRTVTVHPSSHWPGRGLLGCVIDWNVAENAAQAVWHVLGVAPHSLADRAGLKADRDYIVGMQVWDLKKRPATPCA